MTTVFCCAPSVIVTLSSFSEVIVPYRPPIVQMRSRPPGGSGGTLGENNRRPSAEGALSNALRFLLVHASFPAVTARADCGTMGREILLFACEV